VRSDSFAVLTRDHKLESLCSRTTVELFLLAALTQLERQLIIPANFALAYDHMKRFRNRQAAGAQIVTQRDRQRAEARRAAGNSASASASASAGDGPGLNVVPHFSRRVCLKAFESLIAADVIALTDHKAHGASTSAAAEAAAMARADLTGGGGGGSDGGGGAAMAAAAAAAMDVSRATNADATGLIDPPVLPFPSFTGGAGSAAGSYALKEFRTVRLTVPPDAVRLALQGPSVPTFIVEYIRWLD
jgi:hypothetical protein